MKLQELYYIPRIIGQLYLQDKSFSFVRYCRPGYRGKLSNKKKADRNRSVITSELPKRKELKAAPRGKPFEVGNRWWTWRSKHGRDKLFKTSKLLAEAALEYFELCEQNPEKRAELVKYEGGAKEVEVSVRRLWTLDGLTRYLDTNPHYFNDFKARLKPGDKQDNDFAEVIRNIEAAIRDQQVSGAASGFFNGNIISRLNNLVDRKDFTSADLPLTPPPPTVVSSGPKFASSEDDVSLDRDK